MCLSLQHLSIMDAHNCACKVVGMGTMTGLPNRDFRPHSDGDLYQFGVASGRTLKKLLRIYNRTSWGFDSFVGLPTESKGESILMHKTAPALSWQAGAFSSRGRIPTKWDFSGHDVHFISGMYNMSLTGDLPIRRNMRPAVLIDIDTDLYSSAFEALIFMFASKLVVPGTVITYDDWWAIPCVANSGYVLSMGEAKAHAQIARRYRVVFRCICGPCQPKKSKNQSNGWRPYFIVEQIDSDQWTHGFTMSKSDVGVYLKTAGQCIDVRNTHSLSKT